MGIIEQITSGPIGLDTCIFIYFIEETQDYLNLILPIFEAIDKGHCIGVTSGITLIETLVVPLRQSNKKLADQYECLLTNSRGIKMIDLDKMLLREAAYLRATYSIKTPDALQLAAAKLSRCPVFVTNDRRLPTIEGISIIYLSSL
jgi:predicted nucleic acid-binding protein